MLKTNGPQMARSSPPFFAARPLGMGDAQSLIASRHDGRSRRASSQISTWPESVILAALWLAFFGLPVRAFGVDSELARNVGCLIVDIGGMAFVIVGLGSLRRVRNPTARRSYVSIFSLLAVCLLAACTGLVHRNAFLLWVVMGVLPFLSMLVIFAVPQGERFGGRVLKLLVWQTALGVVFATYVILFEPILSRAVWNGPNGDGLGKMAARCLYAAPFLLASFPRLKPWQVLLAVTSWLELALLGVLGGSRGVMTVTFLLIPVFLCVIAVRARARLAQIVLPLLTAGVLLGATIGVGGATGLWPGFRSYVTERWEQAVGRVTGSDPEDLTFHLASTGTLDSAKHEFLEGESRGGEFRDFLAQMTPLDYLFGRGFGGTWYSSYWGTEWLIVHIGPGHLLLVGGFPLLVAFSWVLASSVRSAWRQLPDNPIAAGAFLYFLIFIQSFLQHGAVQDEIEVYFFWICVGLVLNSAVHTAPIQALRLLSIRQTRAWEGAA